MSTESTSSQFEDIREKFGRFRILIVGRANAGKTTILQKICNTTESPEIFDGKGNKIDPSQLEGSTERGNHNIENELIFRSNDKFIFHDSQGFEAGSEDEFERMKKFIVERAKTTRLKERLHAIWYCIPMDKIDRAIQQSEEMFFGKCDSNNVPVVVLFTKFDALRVNAQVKLAPADQQLAWKERRSKIQPLVEEIFNGADAWGRLSKMTYPPKSSVRLENIHKANQGCNILIENTALVLNDEALQMLFVSTQETNIALCVKYAAQR
ncbi:GTP-binding protein [Boletus edulis]|nr:GTP-binding protein [Boletus edulis]